MVYFHFFPSTLNSTDLLLLSKRAKTTAQALLSKRPRQEAKLAIEPPRPAKRVKKLVEKGEREIHVIFSQTTGATIPSVSPSPPIAQASVEKRPIPAEETTQVRPVSKVAKPASALLVEASVVSGSTTTPILKEAVPWPRELILKI
ncbi:hypothetical protein ACFX1Z_013262 [Malus domestica]